MWYVVPVDRNWVEIREGPTRPVKVTTRLEMGDGRTPLFVNTYKGGVCRAVIRHNYFKAQTGRSALMIKQIPAKEAKLFVE